MQRYQWSHLNTQQIGAYAEYFVKMELTMYGFQVFETEVDDRGIDFIARYGTGQFVEVQVKSLRSLGYIFAQKDKFPLRENVLMAVVLFSEGEQPKLFLVPATAWLFPNDLLVSRDYEGKKSRPEWGINVSLKNMPILMQYGFDIVVAQLRCLPTPPTAQATQ